MNEAQLGQFIAAQREHAQCFGCVLVKPSGGNGYELYMSMGDQYVQVPVMSEMGIAIEIARKMLLCMTAPVAGNA